MNYTKGERKLEKDSQGCFVVSAYSAELYPEDSKHSKYVAHFKNEADALLDAAAPEMAEAGQGLDLAIGQAIMKVVKTATLSKEWVDAVHNILSPAQKKWREALAKAEGK